jgi:nucleotide-binding universal stress UspA family protein
VALGFWLGTAVRLPAPAAQPEAGKHALFTLAPRADTVEACLNAAQSLAPAFSDAKLVALHTRMDPTRVIAASEEVLDARASAEFRAAEARQAAAIKSAVASFNARAPRPAEFFDLNADLAAALYAHAKDADFVILGKTPSGPGAEEREALAIALFELKRPLLLVPADWQSTVGTRVCVAWKDMPQTVRAIEAAAAVLKRAGEVRVLAGFRRDAADIGHPEQILGQLGIEAHLVPFGIGTEAVGQTLLRMAHDVSADLLVMGAYSHSRIAEYVLGGVTRYILSHADLPVLMAH